MSYENIVKEGNFQQTATGDYGFRLLEGGESSVSGESFRAIQAIEGAVVTTTTTSGDALTNLGLGEGTIIYGKFDSVSCVSGKVLAYSAKLV
jgi:hypothetical protein